MLKNLQAKACLARKLCLGSIFEAGSGHPGGALSAIDLLIYIFERLIYCANQQTEDKFILSKGHAAPALYAVGSQYGLIKKSELKNLRKLGSPAQGHPHVGALPWVETSTGSLGQGFSVAVGIALGFKHQKVLRNVYSLLGDGELQEGQVWEAAMSAAHYKLNNITAIIDYNKLQSDDYNKNIIGLEPLGEKWRSFGWHVIEIDGHNFSEIENAFSECRINRDAPSVIIAHTIKGKGVKFMEGVPAWHGSVRIQPNELRTALTDLGANEREVNSFLDKSVWDIAS